MKKAAVFLLVVGLMAGCSSKAVEGIEKIEVEGYEDNKNTPILTFTLEDKGKEAKDFQAFAQVLQEIDWQQDGFTPSTALNHVQDIKVKVFNDEGNKPVVYKFWFGNRGIEAISEGVENGEVSDSKYGLLEIETGAKFIEVLKDEENKPRGIKMAE